MIIAAVGVATAATVGGLICNYAFAISPRLAVPVIIVGYLLAGLAIWISIVFYGIYLSRLMATGWPQPVKLPAQFLLVRHLNQVLCRGSTDAPI